MPSSFKTGTEWNTAGESTPVSEGGDAAYNVK